MNVLAGLAEGVLDAILEREDDPRRDPFAVALERYRTGGVPKEAAATWRAARETRPGRDPSSVLRKLDRDLLSGVMSYATGQAAPPPPQAEGAGRDETTPKLALIGAGGPMPSLEMGADGTWHVAAAPAAPDARQAGDSARADVPTLASRYPAPRRGPGPGLRGPRDRTDPTTRG